MFDRDSYYECVYVNVMPNNLAYYVRKVESFVTNEAMTEYEIAIRLGISVSSWEKIRRMLKQNPLLEFDNSSKMWSKVKPPEYDEKEKVELK